jgi:hypothetical protein
MKKISVTEFYPIKRRNYKTETGNITNGAWFIKKQYAPKSLLRRNQTVLNKTKTKKIRLISFQDEKGLYNNTPKDKPDFKLNDEIIKEGKILDHKIDGQRVKYALFDAVFFESQDVKKTRVFFQANYVYYLLQRGFTIIPTDPHCPAEIRLDHKIDGQTVNTLVGYLMPVRL